MFIGALVLGALVAVIAGAAITLVLQPGGPAFEPIAQIVAKRLTNPGAGLNGTLVSFPAWCAREAAAIVSTRILRTVRKATAEYRAHIILGTAGPVTRLKRAGTQLGVRAFPQFRTLATVAATSIVSAFLRIAGRCARAQPIKSAHLEFCASPACTLTVVVSALLAIT